jgi:hypothetical protein
MPDDQRGGGGLLPRGGAHNRADRQSQHLTQGQCERVIEASLAACAAGAPLNRFITGAWQRGGIDAKDSVRATGAFITLAREWMRAKGYPMPWVWVQECSKGSGAHCHILLHVPPVLDPLFSRQPQKWARVVLGGDYTRGVIDCRRFSYDDASGLLSDAYQGELLSRLHYMLKCAPPDAEVALDMTGASTAPWGQSGLVYGKRAAAWQRWRKSQIPK